MNDVKKAGKIAAEVLDYGCSLVKPGVNALEVLDKIELEIAKKNAKPAFPAQISINNVAAHCIPEDKVVFRKEDVVKLDVVVHINGHIGDNARTIAFTDENKKLVEASEKALEEALKIIKPGARLCEVGGLIENIIKSYGFNSVRNLSGHLLGEYEQHAGLTIPNFDNNDNRKLEKGMVIAVEPFATTGVGLIEERTDSGIYVLSRMKNIRDNNSREVLKFIFEEYKTLPFAKRWLPKKFPEFKVNFALRLLKREGIIQEYQQLWEKSNGLVSQAEHTVIVDEPCIITTKISEL